MPLCLPCTFASFCFKMLQDSCVSRCLHWLPQCGIDLSFWCTGLARSNDGNRRKPHSAFYWQVFQDGCNMLYATIFAWQFVWPAEVRLLGLLQKYSFLNDLNARFFPVRIQQIQHASAIIWSNAHLIPDHQFNIPSHWIGYKIDASQIFLQHSKPFNRSRVTLQFRISLTTNVPTL